MPNRVTKGQALIGGADVSGDVTLRGATTISGAVTFSGATAGVRGQYEAVTAAEAVVAADSGKVFVDNKGSATTVFSLPATVAGLTFTFVCGDAGGEINVSPVAADKIQGKGITAADNKDYINTGGSNAVGDLITIIGDGTDGWWVIAERGTWAREA